MKYIIVYFALLFAPFSFSQNSDLELRTYTYVSPSAQSIIKKMGVAEKDLENYARKGAASRQIEQKTKNVVFEGSEDAIRVDLRANAKNLILELSVRQGVSVNNMLERWSSKRELKSSKGAYSKAALFESISVLLDELKVNYNSVKYKTGTYSE